MLIGCIILHSIAALAFLKLSYSFFFFTDVTMKKLYLIYRLCGVIAAVEEDHNHLLCILILLYNDLLHGQLRNRQGTQFLLLPVQLIHLVSCFQKLSNAIWDDLPLFDESSNLHGYFHHLIDHSCVPFRFITLLL